MDVVPRHELLTADGAPPPARLRASSTRYGGAPIFPKIHISTRTCALELAARFSPQFF
jgi:hypothetical protein